MNNAGLTLHRIAYETTYLFKTWFDGCNPDTKPEDLAGIEKQMLELRTKMMGKMENLQGQ